MDVKFERISAVALTRGLHVVRYASSAAGTDAPVAVVRAAEGSEPLIDMLSAPGADPGRLERPGDCLVVRAQGPAKLEIGLRRSSPSGSLDGSFQIDILATAKDGVEAVQGAGARPVEAPPVPRGEDVKFSILGHVAMRGDVNLREGEWVAGPEAPAPVEGVSFSSSDRERLAIETQILVVGAPRWSVWVGDGGYAGTRGRGRALSGIRLRLVGADAAKYELAAEALFLGAMVQAKTGRQLEFVGSAGSDPLVGLKVNAKRAEAPRAEKSEASQLGRGARVRIYKPTIGDKGA